MGKTKTPNIPKSLKNLCDELTQTVGSRPPPDWQRKPGELSHHYVHRFLAQSAIADRHLDGAPETGEKLVFPLEGKVREHALLIAHIFVDLYINWKTLPFQNLMESENHDWAQVILSLRSALATTRKATEKTGNSAKLAQRLQLLADFAPVLERLESQFPEENWPREELLEETRKESLIAISHWMERKLAEHLEVPDIARLIDDGQGRFPRAAQQRLRMRLERNANKDNFSCAHPRQGWVVPLDDQDPCTTTSTSAKSPMN